MASTSLSLREWYEEYIAEVPPLARSPLIRVVKSDILDADSLERRIHDLESKVTVIHGFCSACRDLFNNWPLEDYTQSDFENPEESPGWKEAHIKSCTTLEIEASTRAGCKFCAFLLQVLKDCNVLSTIRKIEARIEELGEKPTVSLFAGTMWSGEVSSVHVGFPNRLATIEQFCHAASIHCQSCEIPSNQRDAYALHYRKIAEEDCHDQSTKLFETITDWLHTCAGTHKSCRAVANTSLPTRLISIVGENPCLIVTAQLEASSAKITKPSRYATLSYCWGRREFMHLRSDNFETYKMGIPKDMMPKTFQDSIEITKALGIDFIWIDALCIIQDDENDWRKECDLMQSIYGNSHINIAASSAEDVYGGCFLKQPYFTDGVQLMATTQSTQKVMQFNQDVLFYEKSVFDTQLMTRGWAIQEKILPRRTLHFGDRGVFWECKEILASESLPRGIVPGLAHGMLVFRNEWKQNFWYSFVKRFSAAQLTRRSDKLLALSGVARTMRNIHGDEYLAGMWRRDIELQLNWWALGFHKREKRPDSGDPDWTAPSWSWASIDGPVDYRFGYSDDPSHMLSLYPHRYAHVLDVELTFIGPKPFGQISHGILDLGCSGIVPGRLRNPELGDGRNPDCLECVIVASRNGEEEFHVLIDCVGDGYRSDSEVVYLLPLVEVHIGPHSDDEGGEEVEEMMTRGLLLRKTDGAAGEFCRFGWFHFTQNMIWHFDDGVMTTEQRERRQSFLQILDEVGAMTAETVCSKMISNSDYPAEKYMISLI